MTAIAVLRAKRLAPIHAGAAPLSCAVTAGTDCPVAGMILPSINGLSGNRLAFSLCVVPRPETPAMLTPRQAQFAFVPAMVTIMSATISFAMSAFHHGFEPGLLQVWLNNWGLAFIVALPVAWVAVPAVRGLLARLTDTTTASAPARGLGEMG